MELMTARRKIIRLTLVIVGGLLVASMGAVIATQPLWAFDLLAWAMPRILWRGVRFVTVGALLRASDDRGPSSMDEAALGRLGWQLSEFSGVDLS
jgi:hypothetical protein